MDLARAYSLACGPIDVQGRFYGPAERLDIGAGLILNAVSYPAYDEAEQAFAIVEGLVYLMSHECDIDPSNERPFSDCSVICPIIPLEFVLARLQLSMDEIQTSGWLAAVGSRSVERVMFIPAVADILPHGGILYFGVLTHTHVSELHKGAKAGAVSAYGLQWIDMALERALRKPKTQKLLGQH